MVCPHGQGEGGWVSADILRSMDVIFLDFVRTSFMDAPND